VATRTRRKAKANSSRRKKAYVKFISVFVEEIEMRATKANLEIAEQIAEEAKDIIESQRYRWKPLSAEYLARKIEMGYDERIYIRTSEFLEKIDFGIKDGKVWVGFPEDAMHTGEMARADEPDKKPIPLWLLARFLEYGTKTIPPRQLWRPLISKYIRNKKKFAKQYREQLKKAVERRT
jgi:hypothetical protein